jgi:hypothetical protein
LMRRAGARTPQNQATVAKVQVGHSQLGHP